MPDAMAAGSLPSRLVLTCASDMKVLHIPFTYYPDPCGGTEVYVAALCRFLGEAGFENVIAAPADKAASYEHESICVHRFATHPRLTQDMMFVHGDPMAADGFARVLDQEKPGLVHFHAHSPAVSGLCLREARKRGIPALSTYHTPTVSCQRGTLMRWDTSPCDGGLRPTLCAACFLNGHGMPKTLAGPAALASHLTQPLARLPGLTNAVRAVLRAAPLMAGRRKATLEWWAGMARVIALCEWTERLLLLNGVPKERIRKVRHGLPSPADCIVKEAPPAPPSKLVFLGRLDRVKGIDLIIDALRLAPNLPVTLDLYTIKPSSDDKATRSLLAQAQSDPRIIVREAIPSSQVITTLGNYHALLVPSRWFETGPLVVLEALAAGIPVIGSDLGGIAEWISHEHNGLLVPGLTPEAWRNTLCRAVSDPALLPRLKANIRPPRTMREVAGDMSAIYAEVLAA